MQNPQLGCAETDGSKMSDLHIEYLAKAETQLTLPIVNDPEGFGLSKVVNIASVKHRSPFRYPGGKTWLVPLAKKWLNSFPNRISGFVEPFAGGGAVGLSVLLDGLVDDLTFVEKDSDVASVWQVIVDGGAPDLANLIRKFDVTEESVLHLLSEPVPPEDVLKRAFVTIVRNRVQRGGIMAPGAGLIRNGENGKGIRSRWYPDTLSNRLLNLHLQHSQMSLCSGDGLGYMKRRSKNASVAWFIDPPYTIAGSGVYKHHRIGHKESFRSASQLKGHFLMTYDRAEPILELVKEHKFDVREVPMKNTHHNLMYELIISRDLTWLDETSPVS